MRSLIRSEAPESILIMVIPTPGLQLFRIRKCLSALFNETFNTIGIFFVYCARFLLLCSRVDCTFVQNLDLIQLKMININTEKISQHDFAICNEVVDLWHYLSFEIPYKLFVLGEPQSNKDKQVRKRKKIELEINPSNNNAHYVVDRLI